MADTPFLLLEHSFAQSVLSEIRIAPATRELGRYPIQIPIENSIADVTTEQGHASVLTLQVKIPIRCYNLGVNDVVLERVENAAEVPDIREGEKVSDNIHFIELLKSIVGSLTPCPNKVGEHQYGLGC